MTEGYPSPQLLLEQRKRKHTIIAGITLFNENPKKGIIFLAREGIIENVDDPLSISKFLKGTTRVNKQKLGEYLSKKQNDAILKAFMATFSFYGKRADEALREVLETFRLPGESMLIERIVMELADRYCGEVTNLVHVADTDAMFVLTYAIIMLNTDQHSPKIKV